MAGSYPLPAISPVSASTALLPRAQPAGANAGRTVAGANGCTVLAVASSSRSLRMLPRRWLPELLLVLADLAI